jgi:uncharacterized membrane protein YkvA (DUF1232 family)
MRARLKNWATRLTQEVHAIYLASGDARVPWYAKALAVATAAYALSPIDLVPDFIPVLGYLDELIILPLAIMLVLRLIPPEIMAEHRAAAAAVKPTSKAAAVAFVAVWIVLAAIAGWFAISGLSVIVPAVAA